MFYDNDNDDGDDAALESSRRSDVSCALHLQTNDHQPLPAVIHGTHTTLDNKVILAS